MPSRSAKMKVQVNPDNRIDRAAFLSSFGFAEEQFLQTGLDWAILEEICAHHRGLMKELQTTGRYVSERLGAVSEVHSLKVRIKDAERLIEKVIRKKLERPDDTAIDVANYEQRVTDLIGVRALHLFKDDWKAIDDFIRSTWELHETPIAYIRAGDSEDVKEQFSVADCRVDEHPFGYRSVHYVIASQPAKCVRLVEIQVRTIFEEGWSEIDHKVRYRRQPPPPIAVFLDIFNRLAGSADEMGTFTKLLDSYLRNATAKAEQLPMREAELERTVSQLKISEAEKQTLQQQIAQLKASSIPDWPSGLKDAITRMGEIKVDTSAVSNAMSAAALARLSFPKIDVANVVITATCSICKKNPVPPSSIVPICAECLSRSSA